MRRALVIQHADIEGVGRFAEWMPKLGLELDVRHPYAGDGLPSTTEAEALIVMGGPMGAYDDADVPWLTATKALLADAVGRGVPTLGVCLGAQLLAVATGGKVERGAAGPERGIGSVVITDADSLFEVGTMPVVQWHYDTVAELPEEAILLGSSDRYRVQAFRVGGRAWGVQFHVEATPQMVADWVRSEGLDETTFVDPVLAADRQLATAGEQLARQFVGVVTA